ncbi:hypothetical protein JG687_00019486 [Phytophthora cactorum]|uniref:Uncharacterized protein n=1 Tax=Phytophthora cactorum TaxID=29920 RepID=A0A8T1TIY7_9STRA|nr:hypothetical protein JG687_00019486 [Phytophthora cactorum]
MKTTRGRAMRRSAARTTTPVARSANALLISKARWMTTLKPRTKMGLLRRMERRSGRERIVGKGCESVRGTLCSLSITP